MVFLNTKDCVNKYFTSISINLYAYKSNNKSSQYNHFYFL